MYKWFKATLLPAVFLVCIFLALELSWRVYLFGPIGFNPRKVGSYSLIFSSGLVQPAKDLEVWYELKPNQSAMFRGVPFRTNSQGLADDEYPFEKPPNTVRIAVVGSSWTMPSAGEFKDAYHSVLERQFNTGNGSKRYEFINFGVEFYGFQEMVATVREKALRYDPDLIVLEISAFTPFIRWIPHDTKFVPRPRKDKTFDSILLEAVAMKLGIADKKFDESTFYRGPLIEWDWDTYYGNIERALDELAGISKASGVPVAVALLRGNVRTDDIVGSRLMISAAERGMAAADVNLDKFLQPGESPMKFMVSRVEPHPNTYAHALIASELRRQIFDTNPLFQIPSVQ